VRKNNKPDTAHGYIRTQHRFWKWCNTEYGITNPMRNIKYPSQPKQEKPKSIPIDQIVKLMQGADQTSVSGKRDIAMVGFLADTGCRASGILGIRHDDINLDECWALVTEKGDKTRRVDFTDYTALLIGNWIETSAKNIPYLFYSFNTMDQLTYYGLRHMLLRLKKKAGVSVRVNAHAFRHGFAREYLMSGGSLRVLADILGHTSITTTAKHYAIFTTDEKKASHEKYSQMNLVMEGLAKFRDAKFSVAKFSVAKNVDEI